MSAISPFKLASVLLQYPTAPLFEGIDALDAAVAEVSPKESRESLHQFLAWFRATPPTEVAHEYSPQPSGVICDSVVNYTTVCVITLTVTDSAGQSDSDVMLMLFLDESPG